MAIVLPLQCQCYAPVCVRVPLLTWKTIVVRKAVDSSLHVEANVEARASVTHTLMRTSRRRILVS